METSRFPVTRAAAFLRGLFILSLAALGLAAAPARATDFVLALSWQPAFCETAPRRPECRSQHGRRADAGQFSLHGLWPQPRRRAYCGVGQSVIDRDKAGNWQKLDTEELPAELKARLDIAMPGTQSGLDRHEWIKHGTCAAGATPESYFTASLDLLDEINASRVRKLFADNVGREVTAAAIRKAFETDFGIGAGLRVRVACVRDGDRRLISEITIGLSGPLAGAGETTGSLRSLAAGASPTGPGCPAGIVDAVGLQ